MKEIIIPILRQFIPHAVAKDIVGVQPMMSPPPEMFTMRDGRVALRDFIISPDQSESSKHAGDNVTVDVSPTVGRWIEDQPPHLWIYAANTDQLHVAFSRYVINKQLYTAMALKWD